MRRLKSLVTRENVWAVLLCLLAIALVIVTAETAPNWIYQGF
ncbi:MAG: hypothetical protein RMK99_12105 [Anaerolineales bacterium]|nr:hypothetical protein [Anaerolineales bacterium]